jgi:hypothetical protein
MLSASEVPWDAVCRGHIATSSFAVGKFELTSHRPETFLPLTSRGNFNSCVGTSHNPTHNPYSFGQTILTPETTRQGINIYTPRFTATSTS